MTVEQKQIQSQDDGELFNRLDSLQKSLRPLRQQLVEHEVYTRIKAL
jgi:hypothetical protein